MTHETKERPPIFDANDYRTLKRLQRELYDQRQLVEKCQRCGIDCSDECAGIDGMNHFLEQIENEFFNPPPPEIANIPES